MKADKIIAEIVFRLFIAPKWLQIATINYHFMQGEFSQSLRSNASTMDRDRKEYEVVAMPAVAVSSIISIGISLFLVGCACAIARWAQKIDETDMKSSYRNRTRDN